MLGISFLSFTGQEVVSFGKKPELILPKVFVLGEHEVEYEQLMLKYNESLLTVCDNDMKLAFGKLMSMFQEMETYAEQLQYDINGVRIWVHLFWDEKGMIQHIGYHLRPNSKNVNNTEFTAFLEDFVEAYRFPLNTTKKYSLYTSTSFPTRYKIGTEK